MGVTPISQDADSERILRSETRRYVEDNIDEELLLKVLQRPVVVHALDGGAEQMLRRYIARYVLPAAIVIGAVAAFFGWQVRETIKRAVTSVESSRHEIERRVDEASLHLIEGQRIAASIKTDAVDISKYPLQFNDHLATIRERAAEIDRRRSTIENRAEVLADQQRAVGAQLERASNQASIASQYQAESAAFRKDALAAAESARESARGASHLVEQAQISNVTSAKAASEANQAAAKALHDVAEIDILRTKADKLLNVGVFEVVMLRSLSLSAELKLVNVADPRAPNFALRFQTHDIKPNGFPLHYRVDGQEFSEPMPPITGKFPYTFVLKGTKEQYEGVVDLIYSFKTAPDFVSLHVRPRQRV